MIQLFIFNEVSRAAIYGIGTYIQQLLACLDDSFQVNIVNYFSDKPEFTVIESTIVIRDIYIPCNQLKYVEGKCDETYFLNSIYLLADFINPDAKLIFHFNQFRYEAMLKQLKVYWPESKIILSVHYLSWCFTLNGNTGYFRDIIRKKPEELVAKREKDTLATYKTDVAFLQEVDHIICLAEYAKDVLQTEYKVPSNKLSLIYNGLKDEGRLLSTEEKAIARKQLHLNPNEKIVLFVGRLDDIKGVDFLIQAFKKLLQERKDCRLIIIGDGEYTKCLEECKNAWERIIFTGKLSKEVLYHFYQIADIGVMLSKHEQCSFVAIEMMMHGLPIIASNSTGLDEMVINGQNGYKIKTIENKEEVFFDIEQCHQLLSQALNNKDIQEMRARCRTQYETAYSLKEMEGKMQELYNTI